jgi:hypothetical protein
MPLMSFFYSIAADSLITFNHSFFAIIDSRINVPKKILVARPDLPDRVRARGWNGEYNVHFRTDTKRFIRLASVKTTAADKGGHYLCY